MANALSYSLNEPSPLKPMPNATAPAPAPMAKPTANALAAPSVGQSPYAMPKKQPQNALLGAAVDGFMRGFAPQQWQQNQDQRKMDGAERAKQTLALMQQQRALPEQQRSQWWQQNAPTISEIIGADVSQMPLDVSKFSDQALDGQIAALSAQLGIGPSMPEPMSAYQAAQIKLEQDKAGRPTPYSLGDGAFAEYDPTAEPGKRLNMIRQPNPADPQDLPEGMWYGPDGKGPPQPIPGYVDMRARIAAAGRAPDAAGAQYRPATPQELQTWNIPPGTPVKVNTKTGEPEVIAGAKPSSEYTPSQQSKFIQQAQTLDAVDGALKAYIEMIDSAGPQLWTTGLDGDNPTAKKLDAARTAILIQAKELFNLGVLNGPDLDIISSAVPDVTGFDALGKNAASAKAQLGVLSDYIARGRNQIPAELLERARPNQTPTTPQTSQPSWIAKQGQRMMQRAGQPSAQQPRQPTMQPNVPPQAVQELMADPSPEAMAEFDDAFGPGAAEAALNGR